MSIKAKRREQATVAPIQKAELHQYKFTPGLLSLWDREQHGMAMSIAEVLELGIRAIRQRGKCD